MATMDDIAKRLGISKGTVSKALSGATDVSESMRRQVLETAVELGYSRPVRQGGRRLCIFIENMAYQAPEDFGWDIIMGFRKMAEPAGAGVDIVPLTPQIQKQIPYDQYMLSGGYSGALFLGMTLSDPWMREFRSCKTPAVLYDNHVRANPYTAYLGIDNEEGMELAVTRLRELGHRKIGYLSGALGSFIHQVRYRSFFRSLRQCGLSDDPGLAGNSYYSSECLERHLPRLLKQGVTAIICSHDLLAHAVLIHCMEIGIRVPEQLSIIGFDDIPLCSYTAPPLASIRQNRPQLGRSAYYALASLMDGIPISTLLLHAELVERASIGPAPDAPLSETGLPAGLA